MVTHTSFPEFVLFLYIHMALADNFLHPSEEAVILEKLPKLFPTDKDLKKRFDDAVVEYKKLSPEEVIKVIENSFKHFSYVKFAHKYKVYTEMYDVINADGKVEESEKIALQALKDVIDLNAR